MARKISQAVAGAFIAGIEMTNSNTRTDGQSLWLFGNKIAEKRADGLYITNAGWFSATTKERLNALPSVSIYQAKKEWYLNGNKWDGKWIKIS
jgi:hypothetical protein